MLSCVALLSVDRSIPRWHRLNPLRSQPIMGIWIELGIFLVVIAFGFYQLHDVKKAQRERRAREQATKASEAASDDQQSSAREP